MKKTLFAFVMLLCTCAAQAQFYGFDPDKFTMLLDQSRRLPPDKMELIAQATMTALSKDGKSYRKALELVEQHSGNPLDSLHNEELYIAFLQQAVNGYVLGNSEKTRPRLLLDNALKNRKGEVATDFAYVTPDGDEHRLSQIATPQVLIYFYDIDCEACAEAKKRIAESETISKLVANRKLTVLAVYTEDNGKKWKKAATASPVLTHAWDKAQAINNDNLYSLPTLPLFYLLDGNKRVVVKNEPSLKAIEEALDVK